MENSEAGQSVEFVARPGRPAGSTKTRLLAHVTGHEIHKDRYNLIVKHDHSRNDTFFIHPAAVLYELTRCCRINLSATERDHLLLALHG